jgi:hypothetical protein
LFFSIFRDIITGDSFYFLSRTVSVSTINFLAKNKVWTGGFAAVVDGMYVFTIDGLRTLTSTQPLIPLKNLPAEK